MGERNRQMAQQDGKGCWRLRVYHRKARGKKSPRLLIKCGDCDASLPIYYDKEGMEIGGVHAFLDEWRAVLGPLLNGADPFKADS